MPVLIGDEIMLSFAAGEPLVLAQHKIVLRRQAMRQWPVLTPPDLSMIGNEQELTAVVRDRTGGRQAKVAAIVRRWVAPHRFRGFSPQAVPSLSAWENEGGAEQRSGDRMNCTIGIRP